MNRRIRALLTTVLALWLGLAAANTTLTVWHDLGDNGIRWFEELNAIYQQEHPDVTITSLSFPTDQWYGRVIAAINTDTAPDLIYNNYERVIRIQDQTGRVMDLSEVFAGLTDTAFLSQDDLRVATYQDRMIIFPVQRVQMAMGVRTSWLEAVGETYPGTWSDVQRIAAKFMADDPNASGRDDTFAFALQAANPRDLIHMLDLFVFGSGLRHTLINPEAEIVIDEERHATVLKEFLKVFTEYGYVARDTINHSFTDMYQVIEGRRAGMFRVGDWNVNKWDGETLEADYTIGAWPQFFDDLPSGVVIGGMRGVAVPENSPNREAALAFAEFMLTREAQMASLRNVGASVRGDFEMEMSEHREFFVVPQQPLYAYDFPESVFPFYPELEAEYHRRLLGFIADPVADIDGFIAQTAADLRAMVAEKLQ